MNYFAFIDETGTNKGDRFFGIGVLTIPSVSKLYDKLRPISDLIRDASKKVKQERIEILYKEGKYDELKSIAKGGKTFELKFDRVSNSNKEIFAKLVKQYFTVKEARFTAIIVDKNHPTYKPKTAFPGTWDSYIVYSCLGLSRETRNLNPKTLIAIVDEITKESKIKSSLEESIEHKYLQDCNKKSINTNTFMCSRVESNSHILVQLVDVLLGCVAFDYKNNANLLNESLIGRRGIVVDELKRQINKDKLIGDFTVNNPNYFSVWEMKWD